MIMTFTFQALNDNNLTEFLEYHTLQRHMRVVIELLNLSLPIHVLRNSLVEMIGIAVPMDPQQVLVSLLF